jgi:cell division protein FtsW (lipid II flippase)
MQKTYWWRIVILLLSIIVFGYCYIASNNLKLGLCHVESGQQKCIVHYNNYIDPLAFMSIFIFAVSIVLFFINDKVFLKWLRFAVVWVILSTILIALTPEYSGGWISMNPDKESVSIWLGLLFVILSLAKIIWDSKKQKRDSNI